MKQKNKFNKCIKRAIKAAYSEREEMQKQRDIWERAISEKDRQIDMLNSMLEVQPLDPLKEAKGEYDCTVEEKPFDEVWNEFLHKNDNDKDIHRYKKNISAFYHGFTLNPRKINRKTDRYLNLFLRCLGFSYISLNGLITEIDNNMYYLTTIEGEMIISPNSRYSTLQKAPNS